MIYLLLGLIVALLGAIYSELREANALTRVGLARTYDNMSEWRETMTRVETRAFPDLGEPLPGPGDVRPEEPPAG